MFLNLIFWTLKSDYLSHDFLILNIEKLFFLFKKIYFNNKIFSIPNFFLQKVFISMFKSLSKSRDYSCLNVEPGDSCVVAATPSPIHTHTVVVNFQCKLTSRTIFIYRADYTERDVVDAMGLVMRSAVARPISMIY